ncbi:DNA-processing protein DprA [Salinispirillum sp. LH 10-3-1]|uniref:DNA-processing protein DprA n=1 Tax=Salinispirillum sp. LH 10-3-1 TaxID=2952525 RepID=A0AB38YFP7_9GAMM
MIDQTTLQWLILHLVPGIGGRRLTQFLTSFGSPSTLPELTRADLQTLRWPVDVVDQLCRAAHNPWHELPELKRIANWQAADRHHLLTPSHADYPWQLTASLPDYPPVLYVQGNPGVLTLPQLAVVGSRRPGSTSRQLTDDWCRRLAAQGVVITSGLAAGIDITAHLAALAVDGQTVAVMGSGFDHVYPKGHARHLDAIAANGAVLTEHCPSTPPSPGNFPRRNRIVAALSQAVLVVEAALKSGSLITAKLAAEYGRDVLAVPGHPYYPNAQGCNQLLRDGAELAADWADVSAHFGMIEAQHEPVQQILVSGLQNDLLALIGTEPTALETLSSELQKPLNELYEALLDMELSGLIQPQGGSYVRLVP